MTFDPLAAVGIVLTTAREGLQEISGTCFLFRHEHVALTAGHCAAADAASIDLVFPRLGRSQRVEQIDRHPTADVALLVTKVEPGDPGSGYPERAFWDRVGNWSLGEEFFAYGFPSDAPTPDAPPAFAVPRLFTGNYQRFFTYDSPSGYRYLAGEMSIPALSGLSGGPVFRREAPQMVTALVTASAESYVITDSVEELREGGSVYRLESRKVITYGLALMLSGVSDWLRETVPPRDGVGWVS